MSIKIGSSLSPTWKVTTLHGRLKDAGVEWPRNVRQVVNGVHIVVRALIDHVSIALTRVCPYKDVVVSNHAKENRLLGHFTKVESVVVRATCSVSH